MGKNNQQLSMMRCHMLELLVKNFKSANIIMAQEVWLNTLEKNEKIEWKRNRGCNEEPSGHFRTEIYGNQN